MRRLDRGALTEAGVGRPRPAVGRLGVARLAALAAVGSLIAPISAEAQVNWRDLVFSGGFSIEGYEGNFSAVTVPVVDSTDQAAAAVGEFAARGGLILLQGFDPLGTTLTHELSVDFEMGFRQFAATGFQLRDYAPREWVGRVDVRWSQRLGDLGSLLVTGTGRGRNVSDRPPMPLFLQPGYSTARGSMLFRSRQLRGVQLDTEIDVERTDYEALALLSQLDLLDRSSAGFEVGASTGRTWGDEYERNQWLLRFYGGFRRAEYSRQDSFDPSDPFRRDRTAHMGVLWSLDSGIGAEIGVEGTINRSNSQRPEYDALSLRGSFNSALPMWDMGMNVLAVLTAKTYVHDSPFARLVPGEEADNASLVYVDFNRPIARNLDGALRFGWTRAETDVGDTYYSRFGTSVLLYFRPAGL